MKTASLLAAASLAIAPGFSLGGATSDPRLAEAEQTLAKLLYGQHSGLETHAFVEICRSYPEAISVIIKAAEEPGASRDERRFEFLCYLLTELGPQARAAVPLLLERLDPSYQSPIRYRAGSTLGVIGKDASVAVAPLIEILRTSSETRLRSMAATALGSIGESAALEQLVIALRDADPSVRTDAGQSLGNLDAADLEARAHAKVVAAVQVRPHFTNLSPADALQVQVDLHYRAFLHIDGKEFWTSPRRYLCDDDALVYEITAPNGRKYQLTQRADFTPPRRTVGFNWGTYDVLDPLGIVRTKPGEYWVRWNEPDTPRLDASGVYRIKQSGVFKDERGTSKPIGFESNDTCYEVSPRFATHASLLEQARRELKRELGVDSDRNESIREDKDETKIVTLHVSKADYPEEKVREKGRGTYFGMSYTCRFTPEGQLIVATARPEYHILCP